MVQFYLLKVLITNYFVFLTTFKNCSYVIEYVTQQKLKWLEEEIIFLHIYCTIVLARAAYKQHFSQSISAISLRNPSSLEFDLCLRCCALHMFYITDDKLSASVRVPTL